MQNCSFSSITHLMFKYLQKLQIKNFTLKFPKKDFYKKKVKMVNNGLQSPFCHMDSVCVCVWAMNVFLHYESRSVLIS